MNYLDSNIIANAFYDNPHQVSCQKAIRVGGVTNAINIIEAFNVLDRVIGRKAATRSIKGMMSTNVIILDVDNNSIFEALKKSEVSKLKFMDLVHLNCALTQGCECILSYDKDFDGGLVERREPE